MISTMLALLLSAQVADPAPARPEPAGPDLDVPATLARLGFDEGALASAEAGEIVSAWPARVDDKELAVAVVALLPATPDRVVETIFSGNLFDGDELVRRHGRIDAGAPDVAFAAAVYEAGEIDEVADLVRVEAGTDFNLSAAELARFVAAGREHDSWRSRKTDAARTAVNRVAAKLLAGRVQAYRDEGLAGIAPYVRDEDDDDDRADPAAELRRALLADRRLLEPWPALARALRGPPADAPGVEQRYDWLTLTVEDRPDFVLMHRLAAGAAHGAVLVERQFFVGHSYNSAQWICVCLPRPEGTLLIGVRRTFTDHVAGVGTSVRHRLGRRALRDEELRHVRAIRAACR